MGPRKLTYEEYSTLLVEIEMVLNCRPLSPMSGDCDDLEALTPAHFLVGTLLTTIPRPSAADSDLDHRTHWKLVQGMRDHFWARWSQEYLSTLQQRTKWTRLQENLTTGDLVVILDPSLLRPNGQWPLGRVLQVHAVPDEFVRVATIKTTTGVYTRPVVKLARLLVRESGQ